MQTARACKSLEKVCWKFISVKRGFLAVEVYTLCTPLVTK